MDDELGRAGVTTSHGFSSVVSTRIAASLTSHIRLKDGGGNSVRGGGWDRDTPHAVALDDQHSRGVAIAVATTTLSERPSNVLLLPRTEA